MASHLQFLDFGEGCFTLWQVVVCFFVVLKFVDRAQQPLYTRLLDFLSLEFSETFRVRVISFMCDFIHFFPP